MILAAGLGTRLKPWTLSHPKALVPVNGVPMLERVIIRLRNEGFDDIIVNVHHFGEQIIEFLQAKDFGAKISISDERDELLDTGGALVKAMSLAGDEPLLVHNVDILSDADLRGLMEDHNNSGNGATLLISNRNSSRKLIFGSDGFLRGWHNINENKYLPVGFEKGPTDREYAFSGIYVTSPKLREEMKRIKGDTRFPIMDYFLSEKRSELIKGRVQENLRLIDIGKPETLRQASFYS